MGGSEIQTKLLRAWQSEFERVNERIADCFARSEPRDRGRGYRHVLLEPLERKNGWQLAEAAGDRSPDGEINCGPM
jgi:sirohydrochlorin ferrochelatase